MDGLRDDIRGVVTLHHPCTLDTAYALALLQEEVTDPVRRPDYFKAGTKPQFKAYVPAQHAGAAEKAIADKPGTI